jgi:hypothetical protein
VPLTPAFTRSGSWPRRASAFSSSAPDS